MPAGGWGGSLSLWLAQAGQDSCRPLSYPSAKIWGLKLKRVQVGGMSSREQGNLEGDSVAFQERSVVSNSIHTYTQVLSRNLPWPSQLIT